MAANAGRTGKRSLEKSGVFDVRGIAALVFVIAYLSRS